MLSTASGPRPNTCTTSRRTPSHLCRALVPLKHASLKSLKSGRPWRNHLTATSVYVEGRAHQKNTQVMPDFADVQAGILPNHHPESSWNQDTTGLQTLRIKDFALVVDETIHFSPGLNVITGESGSGKSVLIDAVGLITGAPAPHDCVRAPASCAVVEGTYLLDAVTSSLVRNALLSAGLPARALPAPNQASRVTVKREIVRGSGPGADTGHSRSRCYVNDAPTSLRVLREIGNVLVDANAQDSAQALRDAATQLSLLDRVAGTTDLANRVRLLVKQAQQLEDSLAELDELADEDERKQMQELCDAVRRLRLEQNEELQLRQTLKNMESRRGAAEQCGAIRTAVVGEPGSGGDGVVQVLRALEVQLAIINKQEQQMVAAERAARASSRRQQRRGGSAREEEEEDEDEEDWEEEDEAGGSEGAASASAALEALSQAREHLLQGEQHIKALARSFQFDAAEHHRVSERLKAVERLLRSHRCRSSAQLLQAARESSSRLQAFYEAEEHQEEWEQSLVKVQAQVQQLAGQLSKQRFAAAARLGVGVEASLGELSMGNSSFRVRVSRRVSSEELPASRGVFMEPNPSLLEAAASDAPTATPPSSHSAPHPSPHTAPSSQSPAPSSAPHQPSVSPEPASAPKRQALAKDQDQGQGQGQAKGQEQGRGEVPEHVKGQWYHLAPGDAGVDVVEFLLSAGPGEPLRPLATVASGGESARVMLALKVAPCLVAEAADGEREAGPLSPHSSSAPRPPTLGTPILILDELDSSIGSRLGAVVGRMLRRICSPPQPASSQVICVTHLPQVACYADQHMRVKKQQARDGRIATVFEGLVTPQQRIQEVAEMLGLEEEVASEMLMAAQNKR